MRYGKLVALGEGQIIGGKRIVPCVREVEIEQLLRELLPFVLVDTQPTEKTKALIARVTRVIG